MKTEVYAVEVPQPELFEKAKAVFEELITRNTFANRASTTAYLLNLPKEAAWLFCAVHMLELKELEDQYKMKELRESFPPFDPPKMPEVDGSYVPLTYPRKP